MMAGLKLVNKERLNMEPSPKSFIPNIDPSPKSSRIMPSSVSARVKPIPMPIPSIKEWKGLFLEAKDSARASIIQFTTISGINKPSASYRAGVKACISISTIVTKDAITTT